MVPANYCVPPQIGYPLECEPPPVEQLVVPDLGGPVLELSFVDVDADGDDELVALRSTGFVVVMDDDSVVTSTFANMVALDLEPTGPHDLAVFSGQTGGVAWLFDGDGSGGFELAAEIPDFPTISSSRARRRWWSVIARATASRNSRCSTPTGACSSIGCPDLILPARRCQSGRAHT